MMTFKEYLIESTIMSTDALKYAMSDYDKRAIGKTDGSKPSSKRLKQLDKRKKRRTGEEEEEAKKRGRPKTPIYVKRESGTGKDIKLKPGRPRIPPMLRRQAW